MCGVEARQFDPMAPLTAEDICWIMDEMVVLEVGSYFHDRV